ncbi:hypothetical protein OQA88_7626 [Cercophora sp. LCS_1]
MASEPTIKFATPLAQSTRSEILTWAFPPPFQNYILTGRSRAAWHTSFIIPQLNLLLDAGLCVNKVRPKHIFLTHGHSDHTLLAPAFGNRDDPPDVWCPVEMAGAFEAFCHARTRLNQGGVEKGGEGSGDEGSGEEDGEDGNGSGKEKGKKGGGKKGKENGNETRNPLDRHVVHPVQPGDIVTLPRAKGITALAFKCDHTVPCIGYVFRQTTKKLKPEFSALSGQELRQLREKEGVEITKEVTTPIFAFLGDTTAATLASEPEWLKEGIPVVITECSFLYESHHAQADKTKHTAWVDLERVVRKWPKTTFLLTHFSMRYTDGEIRKFFKGLVDPPANVVIWADGEDS